MAAERRDAAAQQLAWWLERLVVVVQVRGGSVAVRRSGVKVRRAGQVRRCEMRERRCPFGHKSPL